MIKLTDVHLKFEQRGIAGVNGVSLELNKGEVLALMGPNGSGKTTLINLISGKLTPDKGELQLDGEVRIFSGIEDVEDMNVQRFLMRCNQHDIEEEKKLQLSRDFADIFEFTFQLRQNFSQLSAGQRQKVALAAELVNRPSLLLLDEPFTHLDPHTRKDILRSLFSYIRQQEVSLLWVTHDLEEALGLSDRVALMNCGKLEQLDTPIKIVEKPRNLFVAQFLGYENFLPVKKVNGAWITPWGELPAEAGPPTDEAILIIPTQHWTPGEASGRITSTYLKGLERRASLLLEGREFQVSLRRGQAASTGSSLSLRPDLSQCFLIPL